MIGEKERLTEYNFTENPSIEDLSDDKKMFFRFSLDCFLSCPTSERQVIYPSFLQCVNSVLVIEIDRQLPIVAREHLLRLSTLSKPDYLFINIPYRYQKTKVDDDDVFSMMHDLETVMVTCYGDTKPVNKNTDLHYINDCFLKKEGQQMVLYLTKIHKDREDEDLQCVELLSALVSEPESPPQKPVDHVSQNKDARSSLDLTEKTSDQTQKHSLSFVREIKIDQATIEELMIVNNVLSFVKRPRVVNIQGSIVHEEPFDAQLVESLVSHISFTTSLVKLKLTFINLMANCAADIARSLHQSPNLQELNLSSNPMYNGVCALVENLHYTAHLHKLMLSDVHMGDQECQLLATSLKHVERINVLDLSCNPLSHGIIELARHLHTVPHLTELNLGGTEMGEEEAIAVARGLHNVNLKKLVLSNNPLSHGIIELAKHLHTVPHLTELDLMFTQMGEEEVIAVARALKYVPELKELKLAMNPLGRGVSELIQHLSSIPQLSTLFLYDVQMTKKEAIDLYAAVRGRSIFLGTDYHVKVRDGEYRLCTEAELKRERPVAFDDE